MDTPRDILGSHTPQPAATGKQAASVLPPFSGELRFDKEMKLSCEDFKEPIKEFYVCQNGIPWLAVANNSISFRNQ
jgi:hypothetical protein